MRIRTIMLTDQKASLSAASRTITSATSGSLGVSGLDQEEALKIKEGL